LERGIQGESALNTYSEIITTLRTKLRPFSKFVGCHLMFGVFTVCSWAHTRYVI